ncbi:MAG: type II toxin-antitoxin system VapC family toxin [Actinomycetota bacterium]
MARGIVVDTDLLIDYLRGKGDGTRVVRALIRERRLRLTAITGFELRLGTDFHDRHEAIMALFRSRTLPLDLHSSLYAGSIAGELRTSGTPIGFADCLQAGICIRHELPLATRNRKHFGRVEGLRLVDLDEI